MYDFRGSSSHVFNPSAYVLTEHLIYLPLATEPAAISLFYSSGGTIAVITRGI
jgi:hypothetical protein